MNTRTLLWKASGIILSAASLFFAPTSSAALLFYDGINLSWSGAVLSGLVEWRAGVTGGPLGKTGDVRNENAPFCSGHSMNFGGSNLTAAARNFSPSPSVFISFNLYATSLGALTNATPKHLFWLRNSNGTLGCRLSIRRNATNSATFDLGIEKAATGSAAVWQTGLSLNAFHFIVVAYQAAGTGDTVALWVDPAAATYAGATAPAASVGPVVTGNQANTGPFSRIYGAQIDTGGAIYADEVRLGTTWADVTPVRTPEAAQEMILDEGFESGVLSTSNYTSYGSGATPPAVSSVAREGVKGLKVGESYNDFLMPGEVGLRSELKRQSGYTGSDRWWGFSMFVPVDWPADDAGGIVHQVHSYQDMLDGNAAPHVELGLNGTDFYMNTRYDPNVFSQTVQYGQGGTVTTTEVYRAPVVRGQWIDWVFHSRFSLGADGVLEVWRNGVKVVGRTGPNCYNDSGAMDFSIGIYKRFFGPTSVANPNTPCVLYYDNWRIGGPLADYFAVTPTPSFLEDNFESGLGSWTAEMGAVGTNFTLVQDGGSQRVRVSQNPTVGDPTLRLTSGQSAWTDYAVEGTMKITRSGTNSASILARYQGLQNWYSFAYHWGLGGKWVIGKRVGGTMYNMVASAPASLPLNTPVRVRGVLKGSKLELWVMTPTGWVKQCETTDTQYASGKIGLSTYDADANFDDVVVQPVPAP